MELYSLATQARALWDEKYSLFICDCFTEVEDQIHPPVSHHFEYPMVRPVLNFIHERLERKFCAAEYLLGKHNYQLTDEEAIQVSQFREQLWQEVFDFIVEQQQ